ncbi:MAG: hypothetical protein Q7T29_00695 [Gallionella sp.]|nr:hypothetical protein [Gallionella sp.]
MNKIASLLTVTLLLASSSAWAEADSSADLRYCLDLKSNEEIAKCAGEIAAGEKGKPLSKAEAEKIVDKEKTSAPASPNESSGTPTSDKPGKDLLPEKTESNSN